MWKMEIRSTDDERKYCERKGIKYGIIEINQTSVLGPLVQ